MPFLAWVFIAAQALAHGHTLLSSLGGVDPSVQLRVHPSPVEYRVWTAPRWDALAVDGKCEITVFADVVQVQPVRLVFKDQGQDIGTEQLLDRSWTWTRTVGAGESWTGEFWFLDPIGGAVLAFRKGRFDCRTPFLEVDYLEPAKF